MTERCHRPLCVFVERKTGIPEVDQAKYRKIEMPRGIGKSTLVTQGYILQRICANPNIAILLCNEKLDNASTFLDGIKTEILTNQFLQALFPEIVPPDTNKTTWSSTEILVPRTESRREPTILCIGVGGTVTGMHPDLIIADDIISREAAENMRAGSGDIMGKTNRWINQLVPLLNTGAEPFPEILFIGTRWWAGDSYEYLETAFGYGLEPKRWSLRFKDVINDDVVVPVYVVGDLAVFSRSILEQGRSIWPERPGYDIESLAKLRMTDPILFAANYLNRPSDEVTATFKESWLQFYDWLDSSTIRFTDGSGQKRTYGTQDLDVLVLVDPGGFGVRNTEDRMRAAVGVTGTTPRGEHIVLDLFTDQATFMVVAERILDFGVRYAARRVYIEVAGQQAAFVELVKRLARDRGIQLSFDTVKPEGQAKEARILTLEPFFQRGQIFVGKSPAFTEFRNQYSQFPRTRRVDVLDMLAYGPKVWRSVASVKTRSPEARQRAELDVYYQRRGIAITQ